MFISCNQPDKTNENAFHSSELDSLLEESKSSFRWVVKAENELILHFLLDTKR